MIDEIIIIPPAAVEDLFISTIWSGRLRREKYRRKERERESEREREREGVRQRRRSHVTH